MEERGNGKDVAWVGVSEGMWVNGGISGSSEYPWVIGMSEVNWLRSR